MEGSDGWATGRRAAGVRDRFKTETKDADMGVMAGILEMETLVARLLKLSEEEYEAAVEAKSHRMSNEETVKSMLKNAYESL